MHEHSVYDPLSQLEHSESLTVALQFVRRQQGQLCSCTLAAMRRKQVTQCRKLGGRLNISGIAPCAKLMYSCTGKAKKRPFHSPWVLQEHALRTKDLYSLEG